MGELTGLCPYTGIAFRDYHAKLHFGDGFVGSALSSALCQSGTTVLAVDSFLEQVHPSENRSEFLDDRVVLVKRDLRDPATWDFVLDSYGPIDLPLLFHPTATGAGC